MKKAFKYFFGILASAALLQTAVADEIILGSRLGTGADLTPKAYMSFSPNAGILASTSATSTVGGNAAANGGPGADFYTSGNYNVVGIRSGAWLLDDTSLANAGLSFELNGTYNLDITWGNQSNLKVVRIDVTDVNGTTTFNNVDQTEGINEWMNLGQFVFDGSVGQEVRIWNNEGASSGNVQFDSIRLTPVPEPSSVVMGLLGGGMMLTLIRKRRA